MRHNPGQGRGQASLHSETADGAYPEKPVAQRASRAFPESDDGRSAPARSAPTGSDHGGTYPALTGSIHRQRIDTPGDRRRHRPRYADRAAGEASERWRVEARHD
ncbi:hypothetical protein GCM10011576_47170 [Micromonospora parathelypteridis]|nr:hypothetical protein GCM10011576_47170 [Micromonospora parathelypteridis]